MLQPKFNKIFQTPIIIDPYVFLLLSFYDHKGTLDHLTGSLFRNFLLLPILLHTLGQISIFLSSVSWKQNLFTQKTLTHYIGKLRHNMHKSLKMQLDIGNDPTLRLSSVKSIYKLFDEILSEWSQHEISIILSEI